jgi:ribose transport system permease protein
MKIALRASPIVGVPGAAYLLAVMALVLAIWTPGFFTLNNLTNVALQVAVLAIVTLGMALVILTEGIDLSLGAVLGLCGVSAALLAAAGQPMPVVIAAAVAIGILFGVLNGALVAVYGLPAFIVTLGTFGIAQSVATVLSKGDSVTRLPAYFRAFNDGSFLGLPAPIWALAASFVVTWLLLYRTRFGRCVFAIGGNRRALILSGARVNLHHVAVYVYAAVLTALASFIMTARVNAAHPTIGLGMEFDAIAAVVLGGNALERGEGGLWGPLAGAFAIGVLRNGLNLLGIGTEWQIALIGAVIIIAVSVDSLRTS